MRLAIFAYATDHVHIHGLVGAEGGMTQMSTPSETTHGASPNWHHALTLLPNTLRSRLTALGDTTLDGVEEIRLRIGQPVELGGRDGSYFLRDTGGLTQQTDDTHRLSAADLSYILQKVTQFSLYAVEEELRRGYITIPGGHRVGVAGRIVLGSDGRVKSIRSISSLNIRIARAVSGVATPLRPYLSQKSDGIPYSTLILSPPQCGKTTLIRDIARQWSENLFARRKTPAKVVIVDERSEIAGCIEGIPQFSLGPRVDVLDGCPKAEGMLMAIRSLSPDVLVTDEIGRKDDAIAVLEALYSGVSVITTAHAFSLEDWRRRPHMAELFSSRAFTRYVLLSRARGPGTVEAILDETGRTIS